MSKPFASFEVWFLTGSQHLYGPETLQQVQSHSDEIVRYLNDQGNLPATLICKNVLTTPDEITRIIKEANYQDQCLGVICWMHTFSPSKMWIAGLQSLQKPLLHLHTQYNQSLPFDTIDMDFMNLNQAAHGDREFGYISTRLKVKRKVIVGFWKNRDILFDISRWMRVARGIAESKSIKVARFGDNMRQVAVTEGNKVSAQIQFGWQVNGYGVGDLVAQIHRVSKGTIDALINEYEESYQLVDSLTSTGAHRSSLIEAVRIESGMRSFLEQGDFNAYTDTFEDLHGIAQLPGIATQRLMADGYGFGAEGDWKTSALVRVMKSMATGLKGGNSFMEDYTYHLDDHDQIVLGSHMLEICPSITNEKPRCEIHPLGIGGKSDPVRLVFDGAVGDAINVSIIDLGHRYRMIVNNVKGIDPSAYKMPKLPVARVLWKCQPNLPIAAHAWILAGGAHHTCYSQNLTAQDMEDLADVWGIECIVINDKTTDLSEFKHKLRVNETVFN